MMRALLGGLLVVSLAAGCGGSQGAERDKLAQQVRRNLEQSAPNGYFREGAVSMPVTPGLITCVVARSAALPMTQLREIAQPSPPPALALRVIAACVASGQDVAGVRSAMIQAVAARLPSSFPPAYNRCVTADVNALSPAQLAHLFTLGGTDPLAAQQFGKQIGFQCMRAHPELIRQFLIEGMQLAMEHNHVPPAFTQCMVRKVAQLSDSQVIGLLSFSTLTVTPGAAEALGRTLGPECASVLHPGGSPPAPA